MATASLRAKVLNVYKRILRTADIWEGICSNANDATKEKEFIVNEAKYLFRRNKRITNHEEIRLHLQEAEARLQMAVHYGTPYPRPVNVPPHLYANQPGKKRGKSQQKIVQQSTPIYIKSLKEE